MFTDDLSRTRLYRDTHHIIGCQVLTLSLRMMCEYVGETCRHQD